MSVRRRRAGPRARAATIENGRGLMRVLMSADVVGGGATPSDQSDGDTERDDCSCMLHRLFSLSFSYSSISACRAWLSRSRSFQNCGFRFPTNAFPPSFPSGVSNQSG